MRSLLALGSVIALLALTGCGSNSSSNPSASPTRADATRSGAAAARGIQIAETFFGISRSTSTRLAVNGPNAVQRWVGLASSVAHRTTTSAFDSSLNLYEVITTNADGSGRVDYFTDANHTQSAGSIAIGPIVSPGGPGTFPATIRFTITQFQGTSGTLTVTTNDASGSSGKVSFDLTNGAVRVQAVETVNSDGSSNGTITVTDPNDNITISDSISASGAQTGTLVDSIDRVKGSFTFAPDGSGSLTLTDSSSGQLLVTETIDSSGNILYRFPDGSTQNGGTISNPIIPSS